MVRQAATMGTTQDDSPAAESDSGKESSGFLRKVTGLLLGVAGLLAALDLCVSRAPVVCKIWHGFPLCEQASSQPKDANSPLAPDGSHALDSYDAMVNAYKQGK